MKKKSLTILILAIGICASLAFTTTIGYKSTKALKSVKVQENDSVLRHVVLFKFKDGTSPEKLKEIEATFSALPSKIKEIHGYEWGLNNSPEGLNKGLTHCFFVTFKSEDDRSVYLPHPEHQAFIKLAGPFIEDVTVVDYWTK